MTNKTITLSRELAQETATLIIRDICEYEPDDNPESLCITVKALELILLQRLEDAAALADPVPPAGGEPEVLHWQVAVEGYKSVQCETAERAEDTLKHYAGRLRSVRLVELVDRAHVTRLQAELRTALEACDAYGVQVVELRAEVERLDKDNTRLTLETDTAWIKADNLLQSELTKARELLTEIQPCISAHANGNKSALRAKIDAFLSNQSAPADKGEPVASAAFNDPLYNAESDARNASEMLEEVIELFDDGVGRSPEEFKLMRKIGAWLGRSVPRIDGGSDECAHSEANKIGCPECGEVFK